MYEENVLLYSRPIKQKNIKIANHKLQSAFITVVEPFLNMFFNICVYICLICEVGE